MTKVATSDEDEDRGMTGAPDTRKFGRKDFANVGRKRSGGSLESSGVTADGAGKKKKVSKSGVSSGALQKGTLLGCTVAFRMMKHGLLFESHSLVTLVQRVLRTDRRFAEKVVLSDIKRGLSRGRKCHITHGYLKTRLRLCLTHMALSSKVRYAVPFTQRNAMLRDVGTNRWLKVFGMKIPFSINDGVVFFNIVEAFTLLDEVGIVLRNEWSRVDTILQRHHLARNKSFCFKAIRGAEESVRTKVSLHALLVLTTSGLVSNPERRDVLGSLFRRLIKEVSLVECKRNELLRALESFVRSPKPLKGMPLNCFHMESMMPAIFIFL